MMYEYVMCHVIIIIMLLTRIDNIAARYVII